MNPDLNISDSDEKILVDNILNTAQELFMSIGVRSVTMDDLASHLGMSKKTVYRFINNKAELINYCVQNEIEISKGKIDHITGNSTDAIEEMLLMGTMVIETLKRWNATIIFELKKFYPESWALVETHHSEFVLSVIKNNLLKGINEGLYRPEINVEVLSRIYIGTSQMLLDIPEGGTMPSTSDVYMEFFNYHIRGIAAPKGVGKLAIYKNKIKLTV